MISATLAKIGWHDDGTVINLANDILIAESDGKFANSKGPIMVVQTLLNWQYASTSNSNFSGDTSNGGVKNGTKMALDVATLVRSSGRANQK